MTEKIEEKINNERYEALHALEDWLEAPVLVLSFIWLIIFIVELTWEANNLLEILAVVIWIVFIIDFALRFFLAPEKMKFLKTNWITALSLFLPALRIFRVVRVFTLFRAARAVRGIRLLKLFSSINRGIRALRSGIARRGFVYVILLTVFITLIGAAGMYAFENEVNEKAFKSYGDSLWWTAMIMTTLGSEFWPGSFEGRTLGFFLSLYAFSVFGYITAVLASFFIGRDADNKEAEIAGSREIEELKTEIKLLSEEIKKLRQK